MNFLATGNERTPDGQCKNVGSGPGFLRKETALKVEEVREMRKRERERPFFFYMCYRNCLYAGATQMSESRSESIKELKSMV